MLIKCKSVNESLLAGWGGNFVALFKRMVVRVKKLRMDY